MRPLYTWEYTRVGYQSVQTTYTCSYSSEPLYTNIRRLINYSTMLNIVCFSPSKLLFGFALIQNDSKGVSNWKIIFGPLHTNKIGRLFNSIYHSIPWSAIICTRDQVDKTRTNQSFFARTSLIRHIVLNKRNTKAINKWQGKEIKPHFSHILFLFIALKGQSGIYHRRKHENTSDIWTMLGIKNRTILVRWNG